MQTLATRALKRTPPSLCGIDLRHGRDRRVVYHKLMTTQLEPNLHRNARLLVAAVHLRKTHGLLYAMRFLEDHDFSNVVIWEVLNLIPPRTVGDAPQHLAG